MKYKSKSWKSTNELVTQEFLNNRASRSIEAGYSIQKWIVFCQRLLDMGFTITLYEARKTFSKYVTVSDGVKKFKVRFSNHKPIERMEALGDCDFFVGVSNFQVSTTDQAFHATLRFFGQE